MDKRKIWEAMVVLHCISQVYDFCSQFKATNYQFTIYHNPFDDRFYVVRDNYHEEYELVGEYEIMPSAKDFDDIIDDMVSYDVRNSISISESVSKLN